MAASACGISLRYWSAVLCRQCAVHIMYRGQMCHSVVGWYPCWPVQAVCSMMYRVQMCRIELWSDILTGQIKCVILCSGRMCHSVVRWYPCWPVQAINVQSADAWLPSTLAGQLCRQCATEQGRSKRSGWSGFGLTKIVKSSGHAHCACALL
jgi:hypothetical protein